MANYESTYRTNYFTVTDEDKYDELLSKLGGEDLEDFSEVKDGVLLHGFGGYGGVSYDINGNEDYDGDIGDFLEDLSKILPKDEAVIFTEVGNENLRYISAYSMVATQKDGVQSVDLQNAAMELAKKSLEKDDYTTQMEY